MKDPEELLFETQRRKRASSQKVLDLRNYLEREGQSGDFLSSNALAISLFQRAPIEFLEARTLDDLVQITKVGVTLVSQAAAQPGSIQIKTVSGQGVTSLWLAVTDRPFIITSVTQLLLACQYRVKFYLHPILNQDGTNISLSYIEIEQIPDAECAVLERKLSGTVQNLLFATDDFSQMMVRAETLARLLESGSHTSPFPSSDRTEAAELLRWLTNGGFIFIGYLEHHVDSGESLGTEPTAAFGASRSKDSAAAIWARECTEDAVALLQSDRLLALTRLSAESPIHRRVRLLHFAFQEFNSGGQVTAVHSFLGLLTSQSVLQESSTIPVIRRKVREILDVEDVIVNSHAYKTILDVIDNMPKEEALRLQVDELRGLVHLVYDVENRSETKLSIKFDAARRGASVFIVLPRERFNTDVRRRLQDHIEATFGSVAGSAEYAVDITNRPQVKLFFHAPLGQGETHPIDLKRLELEIAEIARTWRDGLEEQIFTAGVFEDPKAIWVKYEDAFPENYQALYGPDTAASDARCVEQLGEDRPFYVELQELKTPEPTRGLTLVLYVLNNSVTLSQALPVLENSGLEVLDQRPTQIAPRGTGPISIYRFGVHLREGQSLEPGLFNASAARELAVVFSRNAENDVLNRLLVSANFSLCQIKLFRTYCNYLWQISGFVSPKTIMETLSSDPTAAMLLWKMFEARFDPKSKLGLGTRVERTVEISRELGEYLRNVADMTKDRVLRSIGSLIRHTVRTSYYLGNSTIALKIHSEKAEIIPNPRPLFEIFVYSAFVEGVHLRMGRVARGGIRWSDRYEDYRSEVLGLVKTQKIKNAIIVPTGAKGGFVVKDLPTDPAAVRALVEQGYREFIRALLSITDNRTAVGVEHPTDVIAFDGEDPYFVVAADKGTATFSDIANKLAVDEYNFWLGDAFASGGSNGYDHKLYGITARGGWECVKRHFNDLGIDYLGQPFSAIGIGDMAGDVFGNGLILSDKCKLIAAFNHAHVFVDPNPDPAISFEERLRLFKLPQSQWTDYDTGKISPGGAIYGRSDKELTLSPEARLALGLDDNAPETFSGEQLINLILKAPVDLIWNGGIGTYIKASIEANAQVQDRANDRVRVSANEVRAKVIGEGGNLGVTQRGRNEFAKLGGRLNLDAIDNSGGVDLSDHEVNLKILFSELLRDGKVTLEERNLLLKEMAPWVIDDVLAHNRDVALAITVGEYRSRKNMSYFLSLIRDVHKSGYVDRALEVLPDDEEIMSRSAEGKGLFRSELAVCLNAVKLWMKDVINASALSKEPILRKFLLEYFPPVLRQRFREHILKHPLAENVISMQVANSLVASVGVSFVHRMCLAYPATPATVIKCTLAADLLLGMPEVRATLALFDDGKDNVRFLELRLDHNRAIRHATAWLLVNHGDDLTLEDLVANYDAEYRELRSNANEILQGNAREQYQALLEHSLGLGFPETVAQGMALFPGIEIVFETIATAKRVKRPVAEVARIFGLTFEELRLADMLRFETTTKAANKWETELLSGAFRDIRRCPSNLTTTLIERQILSDPDVKAAIQGSASFAIYRSLLEEMGSKFPGVAGLSVVAKQLRQFKI